MNLKAIRLEPNYENAYVLLGFQYMNDNKLEKAKNSLMKAEKLGSKLPWLDLNWALLYEKENKYNEAEKKYNNVFNSKTTNLYAYYYAFEGLAKLKEKEGDYESIDKLLKKYIEHKTNVNKYLITNKD
jgi:tetratricopeptide (TPR) repeat protein